MPYTYMLRCADGTFYVGSTWHLAERVDQHAQGLGAAYTRKRRPVELVWAEEYESVADAYARERQLHGWGRRKRAALIERQEDALPRLSVKRAKGSVPLSYRPAPLEL